MIHYKKRFLAGLLAPLSVLLTLLAHRFPYFTERWFSQGLYPVFTETYGRLFGVLPFSVSQFLVIIFPVGALIYLIWEVWNIFIVNWKKFCLRLVANVFCTVGVLAFLFTIFAGLNYARLEFSDLIGLEITPLPASELFELGETLVRQANELSTQVNRNQYNHMQLTVSNLELARQAQTAFRAAAEYYPILSGFVPITKPIIYSRFMSRLRITGIYSPFTMEAHVNVHVPDYHIPATMLHELAHFRGIMREDEANFIAWLVGIKSGNPYFMYSGTMLALSHTLNQIRRISPYNHAVIWSQLNQNVVDDFINNSEYWRQFTGPLADFSNNLNDAYLRANRQEDGVASYGRMVDLLLAYTRDIKNRGASPHTPLT